MQAENLVIGFARSFSVSPFGGICKRCEAPLQASPRRGDMQAVRSTLAGFAEKGGYASGAKHPCRLRREGGRFAIVRRALAGFAEKRAVARGVRRRGGNTKNGRNPLSPDSVGNSPNGRALISSREMLCKKKAPHFLPSTQI